MNRLTIIGNLTKAPDSTSTTNGKSVCHFTVAVNRRQKKEDGTNEADFFRVSAFGQMGEACQKYLDKGKKVAVTGQVTAHAFMTKDGQAAASLEVFAQDVEFLSPPGQAGGAGQSSAATDQSGYTPVETEELPF